MERKTVSAIEDDQFLGVMAHIMFSLVPLVVLNNGTVAFVLLKNQHWRKKSSTIFMVLMAISDIFGILCRNLDTVLDIFDCILDGVTNFGAIFPVWMQVCLVTERAIAVSYPIKSRLLLSRRNAAITVVVLFVCSSFISFLPNILNVHNNEYCSFSKGAEFIPIIVSTFYFIVPFVWTIICNSIIVWHLKRGNVNRHSENAQNVANSVVGIALVFSVTFFICTAPVSIFNLIVNGSSNVMDVAIIDDHRGKYKVFPILQLVSQIFHATNIVLYIISSKTFRNDLIESFRYIVRCICL